MLGRKVINAEVNPRLSSDGRFEMDISLEGVKFLVSQKSVSGQPALYDRFGSAVFVNENLGCLFSSIYEKSHKRTKSSWVAFTGNVPLTYNFNLPNTSELREFLRPFVECERAYRERPELTLIVKDI